MVGQDLSNDFSDESDYEETSNEHQTFIYNSTDGSLLPKKIKLENPINKKCSVTLEKIRKCDKCDKYFVTSTQYLEHKKIHQQILHYLSSIILDHQYYISSIVFVH